MPCEYYNTNTTTCGSKPCGVMYDCGRVRVLLDMKTKVPKESYVFLNEIEEFVRVN